MIVEALHRHRNHLALKVIRPRAADFLRLEGVVFRAMTVDHFDVAATLFCPQTVGADLCGKQCAKQTQGQKRFC